MFEGAVSLPEQSLLTRNIMLHSNSFSHDSKRYVRWNCVSSVRSRVIVFENDIVSLTHRKTLQMNTNRYLSLARQNSEEIILESYAFRNISSSAEIQVSGNTISEIPTGAFSGRHSTTVDLKNLGIKTLNSDAFAGTSDLTILLQGNSVSKMFPDAFPVGVVRGENCSDFVGWSVYCVLRSSRKLHVIRRRALRSHRILYLILVWMLWMLAVFLVEVIGRWCESHYG